MNDIRRKWILGGVAAVAVAALAFGMYLLWLAPKDPYAGLVTKWDIEMDEATRELLEQRIAITKASITLAKQSGQEPATDLYLSLAQDAYSYGDLAISREAFEAALNDNSLNVAVWNAYANTLLRMEDYEAAERAYLQAIALGGTSEYYMDYVRFLKRFPERDAEVKTVLEYMIKEFERNAEIMVALAEWYYGHDDCARAIDHLEVADDLNPGNKGIADKLAAYRAACSE